MSSKNKPLHLAYLITRADEIGGAQMHVLYLAQSFQAQGMQVTVLAGSEGSFSKLVENAGIPYVHVPFLQRAISPKEDYRCFWALRRLFRKLQPDLVTTHSSKAGWLGRLAAKSLRLPVTFTAHGWAFTEGIPEARRRAFALAERLAARFADRIITVSEYDRQLALRYRVASPRQLVTVYYGIPDVPPALWARPAAGAPVRLIMVARFSPQKDQALVLQALAALRHLPWEIEFVGDGPLRPKCEQLALALGIKNRVYFLGERQDVAERLARAQIFVLASNYEGLPISILEAMRAGLPVIAADVSGVKEGVVHGKTGLLFARGDVEGLKNHLQTLLLHPACREHLGTAGRQRYETHFTLERMVTETWQVYQEVLCHYSR
ncbi:glycosyltransferase family 4 protein [Rhodothermus bifroesti]